MWARLPSLADSKGSAAAVAVGVVVAVIDAAVAAAVASTAAEASDAELAVVHTFAAFELRFAERFALQIDYPYTVAAADSL